MNLPTSRALAVGTWSMNAGIRLRLGIGFGIVLACLAAITALAYWRLTSTVQQVQHTAASQSAVSEVTRNMAQLINDAQVALISTGVVTQAEDVTAQRDAATQALKAYDAAQAQLDALLQADPALAALQEPAKQLGDETRETRGLLNSMWDRIGDPAQRDMLGAWIAFTAQPGFAIWMKRLVDFEAQRKALAAADTAAVEADARWARNGLLLFAGVALLAGLIAGWQISESIVRPIREAIELADRVAQGDLSNHIRTDQGGEAGLLMAALARMQGGLRELVQSVKHTSSGIAMSSGEVAAGNDDLSQRTEQTAAELQRTAVSMHQLSETVRHTAEAARHANDLAGVTSQAVERGSAAITLVADSMGSINMASRQIAEITGVIDGIAFQTNILALNAAVEAARAGEQGRGFAVVASEVRALAQRSAEAAKAIKGLIAGNVDAVRRGDQQVSGTVKEMGDILVGVRQVSETIASITSETNTQSQQLGLVNDAVTHLDEMTQQNAAMVEQSSAAARSLSDEATRLQKLVQSFRIDEALV